MKGFPCFVPTMNCECMDERLQTPPTQAETRLRDKSNHSFDSLESGLHHTNRADDDPSAAAAS